MSSNGLYNSTTDDLAIHNDPPVDQMYDNQYVGTKTFSLYHCHLLRFQYQIGWRYPDHLEGQRTMTTIQSEASRYAVMRLARLAMYGAWAKIHSPSP
jgi:hypothetical protein